MKISPFAQYSVAPSKEFLMIDCRLVVVVPVYEDAESAICLLKEISARVESARIVIVDDGSLNSPMLLRDIDASDLAIHLIKLRRNIGHQAAIAVGLSYVYENLHDYDCVVVMDSDGEDRPDSLPELLRGFMGSRLAVRVAERRKRTDSVAFKVFYSLYKTFFKSVTGRSIRFGNFMVMKPVALSRLTSMNETWMHLAGAVIASKLGFEGVALDRGTRYAGKSKMNFVSLVLHGLKAIMVFSDQVLIRMIILCFVVAAVSLVVILTAIVFKIINLASPGWLTIVFASSILIFLQTGVITLVMLMMTGHVKGASLNRLDYKFFVEEIVRSDQV